MAGGMNGAKGPGRGGGSTELRKQELKNQLTFQPHKVTW